MAPLPPSEAVSSAVWVALAHPDAGSTNTYAAPSLAVLFAAPATIVFPDTATDDPRAPPVAPSEAVSSAVWVAFAHPDAGFTNTYTAPCCVLAPTLCEGAPATIVFPDTATDRPSSSSVAPSEAVSSAVWVAFAHPDAGF